MPQVITLHSTKNVLNAGWIIKHWREVKSIKWEDSPADSRTYPMDGKVTFELPNCLFVMDWNCYQVFIDWVNRPIFKGLPLTIIKQGNNRPYTFTVGQFEKLFNFRCN